MLIKQLKAFFVWNTAHIKACLRRLKADGRSVEEDDLKYLSPLLREYTYSRFRKQLYFPSVE